MARATDITEIGIPSYYAPWWQRIEVAGHNVIVTVDDPDHDEGSGKTITKTLTPAMIHAAFNARADKFLCCAEAMVEMGYDFGCSEDADQVLQAATFGDTVYG